VGIDKNYSILAVDDAKDTLMLLEFDLAEEGYQVLTSASGEKAIALLKSEKIDLILLDMYMPGMSGLDVLKQLKFHPEYKHIPIIMLSASDDEDQVVSALELGADDYVIKPYIAKVLLARMKTSIRLMEKTIELERLAKTDYLTKLKNKGGFEELAIKAISQANREKQPILMAMLDIDLFKHVNDRYGHEAGDTVLVEFSRRVSECFRDYDIIGRVGGEEFAICMPNISLENAFNACERFRSIIENESITIQQANGDLLPLFITVSIGLSEGKPEGIELESLLREADTNLYAAKNSGRNNVKTSGIEESEITLDQVTESEVVPVEQQNTESESLPFPGIDFEVGVNNVLGDEGLFKDILQMFYEDHCSDGDKIRQAIADADQAACKHLVHTLKGVSSSVGAITLFELVKTLDIAINENNTEQYEVLFEPVATALDIVMNGIRQEQ
jgi:diguanylate cyclase (GGDEF)-like protein